MIVFRANEDIRDMILSVFLLFIFLVCVCKSVSVTFKSSINIMKHLLL